MNLMGDAKKYLKFVIGGGLGLVVNLSITYVLTEAMGVWFWLSYAIALAANVTFNFYYHITITFRKKSGKRQFMRFVPLTMAVTAANYIFVRIFTELIILQRLIPIAAFQPYYNYLVIVGITGALSIMNYYANREWVFKN